mmetsp:Transcript_16402/g.34194  ORF Transcript_16402/g.34194 Transcript_16402/m.34194 type:complete len:536 (-) Transcript_16402:135-1742(-)
MTISLVSNNHLQQRRQISSSSSSFYRATFCAVIVLFFCCMSLEPQSRDHNNNSSLFQAVEAFTMSPNSVVLQDHRRHPLAAALSFRTTTTTSTGCLFSSSSSSIDDNTVKNNALNNDNAEMDSSVEATAIRAPLKFNGPYPCMALKFPNLSTESQRNQNLTGISLDFVLDTAANINTIQSQVATELCLPKQEDSPALPGVSSSGPMAGGDTYVLGDSQLEEVALVQQQTEQQTEQDQQQQQQQPFDFMQNLTAAALPVGNPGSAGLLGLAFFYCFEGGVEFRWGSTPQQQQLDQQDQQRLVDGMMAPANIRDDSSPSVTFYGEDYSENNDDSPLQRALSELVRVPLVPIPVTQLPSLTIKINGVEMMALLDTGSPVTVLNEGAARAAGVQTTKEALEGSTTAESNKKAGGWKNPFSSVVDKFKEAQATAEAASRGEILMIGGSDGKPTTLYRSAASSHPTISMAASSSSSSGAKEETNDINFGNGDQPVYVGDIPGLVALNAIGVDSPPAVVLGLDVLRRRPKMLFRPRENEVYF